MLYRVFDSLAYEEEESHSFETGINVTGDLDEGQTKDLMPLVWNCVPVHAEMWFINLLDSKICCFDTMCHLPWTPPKAPTSKGSVSLSLSLRPVVLSGAKD